MCRSCSCQRSSWLSSSSSLLSIVSYLNKKKKIFFCHVLLSQRIFLQKGIHHYNLKLKTLNGKLWEVFSVLFFLLCEGEQKKWGTSLINSKYKCFTCLFIQLLSYAFIYSFIYLFFYLLFIYSFIHSFESFLFFSF